MPNCPKCGSEVDEKMAFCPKCGTALILEQPPSLKEEWRAKRSEWRERRREERRQSVQAEKGEKHEFTFLGPLIGGLVLIILGAFLYFWIVGGLGAELLGAVLLIIIGVIIIGFALYYIVVAERRHRRP
jgi:Flp pilus assembly protein TadB